MDNPGVFSLGDITITTADTYIGEPVENLHGMLGLLVQLRFAWGSGGITARAYVQNSADQGTTWVDCACVLFGAAPETALWNFSALTPKTQTTPTDGALADDTSVDGLLADRCRVKIVTTGTYAGPTVLSGRIVAR